MHNNQSYICFHFFQWTLFFFFFFNQTQVHHVHRSPQAKYIMNQKINYNDFTSRRLLRFFSKVKNGKVQRMKGRMKNRYEEL